MTAPCPTREDMVAARASLAERQRVDRMWAAYHGVDPLDVPALLARLKVIDLRCRARELEEATLDFAHARLQRDIAGFMDRTGERHREAA